MKKQSGFTLVELMFTVVVAAILLAVGIPSFRTIILNSRLTTAASSFIVDANLARSEAIKRGAPVDLKANSGGWTKGWTVQLSGGGTVLKVADALQNNVTITAKNGTTVFTFAADGSSNATDDLYVCDDRTGETGSDINVANSGRVASKSYTCP